MECQKWAVVARYNFLCNPQTGKLPSDAGKDLKITFNLSLRQIQCIIVLYEKQMAAGKTFPNLASRNDINKGPIGELTDQLMECILKFNFMEGYRLPIRQFTLRFNEVHGTQLYFTSLQCESFPSY
jgi:hypothetical protein